MLLISFLKVAKYVILLFNNQVLCKFDNYGAIFQTALISKISGTKYSTIFMPLVSLGSWRVGRIHFLTGVKDNLTIMD